MADCNPKIKKNMLFVCFFPCIFRSYIQLEGHIDSSCFNKLFQNYFYSEHYTYTLHGKCLHNNIANTKSRSSKDSPELVKITPIKTNINNIFWNPIDRPRSGSPELIWSRHQWALCTVLEFLFFDSPYIFFVQSARPLQKSYGTTFTSILMRLTGARDSAEINLFTFHKMILKSRFQI
jgi:hypothetical protein